MTIAQMMSILLIVEKCTFYSINILGVIYSTTGPIDISTITCYLFISASLCSLWMTRCLSPMSWLILLIPQGSTKDPSPIEPSWWSFVTKCHGISSLTVNGFCHIQPYSVSLIFHHTSTCSTSLRKFFLIYYILPRVPSNILFS